MTTKVRLCLTLTAFCLLTNPLRAQLIGITWAQGELYSISPIDASVQFIGSTGLTLPDSLEFGPGGRLFTTTNGIEPLTSELYEINPANAAAALIGPTGVPQFEGALAFAPDGTAYGGASFPTNIYTIDIQTGQATILGSIGDDVNGMVYRSDGKLVAFGAIKGFYSIDLETLATTTIAQLPAMQGIGGMTVWNGDGYLIARRRAEQVDSLFKINLFNGELSLVGKIDLGEPASFFGWFSGLAAAPVPEPASVGLFIVAMLWSSHRLRF